MNSAASTNPQKITKAEAARVLEVSRQAIGDLIKREIIQEDSDGLIDITAAKQAILDNIRPSGKSTQKLQAEAPEKPTPEAKPPTPAAAADAPVTSYHMAKTLRETAEAGIAQTKLKKIKGDLIEKASAIKFSYTAARGVRDHLAARRRSISPALASCTDIAEVEEILRKNDQQLLENLVRNFATFVGADMTEAIT